MTGMILAERYRLGRLLGEGGMGYVYEALHLAIDKRFAVKVLAPEMCNHQTHVERFLREARTTSKIDHDNIVEISDCGPTPDGSVFFVMEYLEGEDLGVLIEREGPQPWERTRKLMLQLCEALSAAHALGIVHRDIKPQNCFRTTRRRDPDFLKVLDFGIAKLLGEEHTAGKKLTRSGQIFGTPEYMSPEQIRGMPADPRMDIYAAGVIMYELLVGKTPFEGDAPLEVLTKHIHEPVPGVGASVVGESLARQVDAVIAGALAKDASRRFQSAEELAAAITAIGAAGSTQRTAGPVSVEGLPAALTGARREVPPSKSSVALVIAAVLVLIGVGVTALVAFGFFDGSESSRAATGTHEPPPVDESPAAMSPEPPKPVEKLPSEPPVAPLPVAEPVSSEPEIPADAVAAEVVDQGDRAGDISPLPKPVPKVGERPTNHSTPKSTLKPKTPLSEIEARARTVLKAHCLDRGLVRWEKGETAKITLSVQPGTGKVTKVNAALSNPAKGKIDTCIVDWLRVEAFPGGREGGKYPFTLERPR